VKAISFSAQEYSIKKSRKSGYQRTTVFCKRTTGENRKGKKMGRKENEITGGAFSRLALIDQSMLLVYREDYSIDVILKRERFADIYPVYNNEEIIRFKTACILPIACSCSFGVMDHS
jgi:hypothetical protein